MKKSKKIILGIIVVLAAVGLVFAFTGNKKSVTLNTSEINQGEVEITVMATGYVQPIEVVQVGTQVSGVIEKIHVDFNSYVKKGQLLAKLETNTLMERVNQASASVRAARSDLDFSVQNYTRVKTLFEGNAATRASYEDAANRRNQAETNFENAKATLKQAEVDLSYAYIYSPIDGVVLDRAVNTGQTVAAAFATPTLFTIAEDLTKMQVEADVDEADIGQVRVGQQVKFSVDAYPDDVFSGTVSQVRLQPVVVSNVVTYTVVVNAPNPQEKLLPGMTASITIIVATEKGLLVPVEALNYKMNEEISEHYGLAPDTASHSPGVWLKSGEKVERVSITTGLNDGIFTVAQKGLNEGQEVILSASIGKEKAAKRSASIMPRPPSGGRPGPRGEN